MREIILTVDRDANKIVKELMDHYKMHSEAEIFGLGLKLLAVSATIDKSKGEWELIARNAVREKEDLFRMIKPDFENCILDTLNNPSTSIGNGLELPGTIGKLTEREKFHAAKQILLGIAILYVFTVLAYLWNTVAGTKLLDIITVTFPPLATLILAAYFKNN